MAGNYNRVVLVGNLTRDPESVNLPTGQLKVKFSLAVSRQWKNKSGESAEETTFVDIVAWDKLAEVCQQYLRKGSSVLVEGRLSIRSYEDKDGNKRKATEVVIDNMQMLGNKAESNGERYSSPSSSKDSFDDSIEDEIPF